jgi:hypothetical protein
MTTLFTIEETRVTGFHNSCISVEVAIGLDMNYFSDAVDQGFPVQTFQIRCSSPPSEAETYITCLLTFQATSPENVNCCDIQKNIHVYIAIESHIEEEHWELRSFC